jgi:chemotaxis protein methyltransferase CheR
MLRGTGAQEGKMRAGPETRHVISFRRLNLNDEVWPLEVDATFDLIFCRNVLMYFDPRRREQVLRKILKRLSPQGYLFLGDAEGLTGFDSLRMVEPAVHTFRTNAHVGRASREDAAEGGAP